MLIDTQILSFAYKGKPPKKGDRPPKLLPDVHIIPSTVCQEFLETQNPDAATASYYVPFLPQTSIGDYLLPYFRKRNRVFRKERTDQIILDFNNEYPSHIEFGHNAISNIINDVKKALFHTSISKLGKKRRKKLKSRFNFITSKHLKCEPLSFESIEIGLELLSEFLESHEPKDNFRNTVNDIMILALAESNSTSLWTDDILLSKFAEKVLQSELDECNGLIKISPQDNQTITPTKNRESKEYINKGWSYRERNLSGAK